MTDEKQTIANLRNENAPTPVTQEEVAYKLFRLFTKGNAFLESPQDGLTLFAKCMLAVREPQTLLTPVEKLRQ